MNPSPLSIWFMITKNQWKTYSMRCHFQLRDIHNFLCLRLYNFDLIIVLTITLANRILITEGSLPIPFSKFALIMIF